MKPSRNPDVKTTLLPDGHVVLFSTKTDWAHTLNPAGALVWEYCDGENSVEEIVSEVLSLVESGDREGLHTEIKDLIENLSEQGLLVDTAPDAENAG